MEKFNCIKASVKVGDIVSINDGWQTKVKVIEILSVESYALNSWIEFHGERVCPTCAFKQGQLKNEFTGWLSGHYDDFGFYNTKSDAERAYQPEDKIDDLFSDFKGKKVRIIIEVIEE